MDKFSDSSKKVTFRPKKFEEGLESERETLMRKLDWNSKLSEKNKKVSFSRFFSISRMASFFLIEQLLLFFPLSKNFFNYWLFFLFSCDSFKIKSGGLLPRLRRLKADRTLNTNFLVYQKSWMDYFRLLFNMSSKGFRLLSFFTQLVIVLIRR